MHKSVNKNYTKIAVLTEHVDNQNSKVEKLEREVEGAEGTLQEHDEGLRDLFNYQKKCDDRHQWSQKKALAAFGGGLTLLNTFIILLLKFVFGF